MSLLEADGLAADPSTAVTPTTPGPTTPPDDPERQTDPASCGLGMVDGIPYAEVFNGTGALGIDPRLVAAVAWVETGGFAEDVIACRRDSDAGARGIMQLMPGTGRELGVDPCDPEEAIPGGARYLLQQYERFGTWPLALAAYNAGPGAVEGCRCVPHNGETEDYVPAVEDKWEEYKEQFPDSELSGTSSGPVTPGPVEQRGGDDPYVDPNNTPTMQRAVDEIIAKFGRGHGVGCHRSGVEAQDHAVGRACDFMMSTGGQTPSDEMRAHGQALANWLVENARALGVQYVIWEQRIWNIDRADEGWRRMGDRGSVTQNHYDHVHVSVQR